MKTIKLITLSLLAFMGTAYTSAQTVEEVINKYVDAIGGKDQLSKITSLCMEGMVDVMGSQGTLKMTTVEGKAFKQDINVAGTQVVTCFTENGGWSINPMAGSGSAEDMPADQYKAGKGQIFIAGPFLNFGANGYTAELIGQETVGDINANKIKIISPDSLETFYFFDPESGYLVQTVQSNEMMGQMLDITMTMSDYQKSETGYVYPHKSEINYGGQFFLTITFDKVEVNQPVDMAIFEKP